MDNTQTETTIAVSNNNATSVALSQLREEERAAHAAYVDTPSPPAFTPLGDPRVVAFEDARINFDAARDELQEGLYTAVTSGVAISPSVLEECPWHLVRGRGSWGAVGRTVTASVAEGVFPLVLTALLGDHWSLESWPYGFGGASSPPEESYWYSATRHVGEDIEMSESLKTRVYITTSGRMRVTVEPDGSVTIGLHTSVGMDDLLDATSNSTPRKDVCYFAVEFSPSGGITALWGDRGLWTSSRLSHLVQYILPAMSVAGFASTPLVEALVASTNYSLPRGSEDFFARLEEWGAQPLTRLDYTK